MKIHSFALWAVLSTFCSLALADGDIGLELLPRGRPFRPTFADPREIRMALAFEGDARLNALIGNYFSLFALKPVQGSEWIFHFGLEGAGFFTMRHADGRFPLETADGLIGVYAEASQGIFQYQFRYTHISAHLADGSSGTPIAYSREFTVLRGAVAPSPNLQAYAGVQLLVNSTPRLPPVTLQCGGSAFLSILPGKLTPFIGLDFKWRKESVYNPSFNGQLGVALNNPPEAYRSFRFFYAYFTGADPRGQFYDRPLTSHSFGIEMQI